MFRNLFRFFTKKSKIHSLSNKIPTVASTGSLPKTSSQLLEDNYYNLFVVDPFSIPKPAKPVPMDDYYNLFVIRR